MMIQLLILVIAGIVTVGFMIPVVYEMVLNIRIEHIDELVKRGLGEDIDYR